MTQATSRPLEALLRTQHGKGSARRLRASGDIPAVLYGQGGESQALAINPHVLRKAMDPERRYNTLFTLSVKDGEKVTQSVQCMIADVQVHQLRGDLLHVDFLRVDPEREVERSIPVQYAGRAIGVTTGGRLQTLRRSARVAARPRDLPVALVVDVTSLDLGKSLRFRDISVENVRILEPADVALAFVEMPKAKTEGAAS